LDCDGKAGTAAFFNPEGLHYSARSEYLPLQQEEAPLPRPPQFPCFTRQMRNRFVFVQIAVGEYVVNVKTHLLQRRLRGVTTLAFGL
jgi:hypothetical protein